MYFTHVDWLPGVHTLVRRAVSVHPFARIVVQKRSSRTKNEGRLILRDGAHIGAGVNILAAGGVIRFGRNSGIAPNGTVICSNHLVSVTGSHIYGGWDELRTGVELGDNVIIGACSVLLPGTRIGDGTVIAAGSVVRGEVPSA